MPCVGRTRIISMKSRNSACGGKGPSRGGTLVKHFLNSQMRRAFTSAPKTIHAHSKIGGHVK